MRIFPYSFIVVEVFVTWGPAPATVEEPIQENAHIRQETCHNKT
jgi:hypothetical protein